MALTTDWYHVGKLLLYTPPKTKMHSSIPKGFYIVVKKKFPKMLLCPLKGTELLLGTDGNYIVYKHSAVRSVQLERSPITFKIDESLIPKNIKL